MMTTRPGPLTRQNLPSMNTTPRSYSRRMRNDAMKTITIRIRMPPKPMSQIMDVSLLTVWVGLDIERQPIDAGHSHQLPARKRRRTDHAPAFAVYARPALVLHVLEHDTGR